MEVRKLGEKRGKEEMRWKGKEKKREAWGRGVEKKEGRKRGSEEVRKKKERKREKLMRR